MTEQEKTDNATAALKIIDKETLEFLRGQHNKTFAVYFDMVQPGDKFTDVRGKYTKAGGVIEVAAVREGFLPGLMAGDMSAVLTMVRREEYTSTVRSLDILFKEIREEVLVRIPRTGPQEINITPNLYGTVTTNGGQGGI